MSSEEIMNFAIKNGFIDIKEIGSFKGYKVFLPVMREKSKIIGYPRYIIVKDGNISLKLDSTMELTKHFYADMEN